MAFSTSSIVRDLSVYFPGKITCLTRKDVFSSEKTSLTRARVEFAVHLSLSSRRFEIEGSTITGDARRTTIARKRDKTRTGRRVPSERARPPRFAPATRSVTRDSARRAPPPAPRDLFVAAIVPHFRAPPSAAIDNDNDRRIERIVKHVTPACRLRNVRRS